MCSGGVLPWHWGLPLPPLCPLSPPDSVPTVVLSGPDYKLAGVRLSRLARERSTLSSRHQVSMISVPPARDGTGVRWGIHRGRGRSGFQRRRSGSACPARCSADKCGGPKTCCDGRVWLDITRGHGRGSGECGVASVADRLSPLISGVRRRGDVRTPRVPTVSHHFAWHVVRTQA